MNHDQFDRIESYLQGTLPESEKQVFEADLRTDATLRSNMEIQHKLRLSLRALAIEKQLIAAQNRAKQTTSAPIVRRLPSFQAWGIAASIVVALGVGWGIWQFQLSSKDDQLAGLAEQEMVDSQYKSMPFDSLQALTQTASSDLARDKAEWYIALVYLKQGKKKEAQDLLIKIVKNPQHAYQQEAQKLLKKGFN
jgi:hypothetical protein